MSSSTRPPRLDAFVTAEKLGSGSFAEVYKCYRKGTKREVVAVKAVLKSSLSKAALDNLISEIGILKKLNHEHIVEMKDFLWDEEYIYIIMEYCSGGDLSRFIKTRQRLPEEICQRFLQQMASALKYMRGQNISHLDLKPQNILLSNRRRDVIKIADFGLAQPMDDSDINTKIKGSPLYMAPEILIHKEYNPKVDIWSIGVILYECLFGKAPYSSRNFKELVEKIVTDSKIQIPVGTSISTDCKHLLLGCLERDVEKRIDFEEFFVHPFVDLEHKASPTSMSSATELLAVAVDHDTSGQYEDAVKCYVEALRYLVPLMHAEADAVKRATMRRKIKEYLSRTEELKLNVDPNVRLRLCDIKMPFIPNVDYAIPPTPRTNNLPELMKLMSTTPQIQTGVDIAQTAELYEKEGNYTMALEKYELALGKLLPILHDEPNGKRRDLLLSEINRWMSQAENAKLLGRGIPEESVTVAGMHASAAPLLEADSEKSCSIQ